MTANPVKQVFCILVLVFLAACGAALTAPTRIAWDASAASIADGLTKLWKLGQPPEGAGAALRMISVEGGMGSGVHIGNGFVLTAAHVVTTSNKHLIELDSGERREASMLWANSAFDVALMKVDPAGIKESKLRCVTPSVGDTVKWIGNPYQEKFVASWGRVASVERKSGPWQSVIMVNGPVIPGHSGGPLLDGLGRVVGILVGVMTEPLGTVNGTDLEAVLGIGYAVPGSAICGVMGKALG